MYQEDLRVYYWLALCLTLDTALCRLSPHWFPVEGEEATVVGSFYDLRTTDVVAPHYRDPFVVYLMSTIDESTQEVTLVVWLKHPGDALTVGDALAEVLTDKVNVEVEASLSGILETLLVEEGAIVAIGQPIALLITPE